MRVRVKCQIYDLENAYFRKENIWMLCSNGWHWVKLPNGDPWSAWSEGFMRTSNYHFLWLFMTCDVIAILALQHTALSIFHFYFYNHCYFHGFAVSWSIACSYIAGNNTYVFKFSWERSCVTLMDYSNQPNRFLQRNSPCISVQYIECNIWILCGIFST